MNTVDLTQVEPFEICSIRPPTENYSLTFRLTRNCNWNQCLFCPVYKYGARFSRRGIDDVKKDVDSAKIISDMLMEYGIKTAYAFRTDDRNAARLLEEIRRVQNRGGQLDSGAQASVVLESVEDDDRLQWFASWFKDKPTLEDSVYHVLNWQLGGGQTCFLGDSNSLILNPNFFTEVVSHIRQTFPTLKRFTIYGRTKTAAKMDRDGLRAFKEAGLDRIHFGLESGNDAVLQFMKKGSPAADHVRGCLKAKEAGISCCVYVMPGLGGAQRSHDHAYDTARVLTEIAPDYVRIRSLEIFPRTGLADAVKRGDFLEASEEQVVREIRIMVENIDAKCEIVSDSASNLLAVNGRLPDARESMLDAMDGYLSLSTREKLAFSLQSRLQSFYGQYGGFTPDIRHAIAPYVRDGRIDIADAPDHDIINVIQLVRSKLMP